MNQHLDTNQSTLGYISPGQINFIVINTETIKCTKVIYTKSVHFPSMYFAKRTKTVILMMTMMHLFIQSDPKDWIHLPATRDAESKLGLHSLYR